MLSLGHVVHNERINYYMTMTQTCAIKIRQCWKTNSSYIIIRKHQSLFYVFISQVLRLVRVTRILRVFKLVRHFAGLQSLFSTLVAASKELGLLIMLVGVTVLTLSSLVYFAEKDGQDWSFMDSFWWGLLTITTVGWGMLCKSCNICLKIPKF